MAERPLNKLALEGLLRSMNQRAVGLFPGADATLDVAGGREPQVLRGLHGLLDGDRQGLCTARNAACDHQRRAELPARAREGEQQPGHDAAPGQRQRHPKEDRDARY